MKKAFVDSEKKKREICQEFEKYKVNVIEAFKNAKDIVKAESKKEIEKLKAENGNIKDEMESSKKLLEDAFKTASIERKKNEKSIRDCSKVFEKKIAVLEKENKTFENAKEKSDETIARLEDALKNVENDSVKKSEEKLDEFSKLKDAEIEEFKKSLKGLKKKFEEEKEKHSEKVKAHEKTLGKRETEIKHEFIGRIANMEKEIESAKEKAKKAKSEMDEKEEQLKSVHEENVALQSKFVQDKIKMQKLHDEENARRAQEKTKLEKLHEEEIERIAAELKIAAEEKEKCEAGHKDEKARLAKEHEEKNRETFKKLNMITEERLKEKAAWEDSLNKKDVALTKVKIELKGKEIEVAKTNEDFKNKNDAFKDQLTSLAKDVDTKATEVLRLRSEREQAFKRLDETCVKLDEAKEQMKGSEKILTSLKDGNRNLMDQKLVAEREFSKIKDKLFKSEANHESDLKEMETKKKAMVSELAELISAKQRQKSQEAELKVLRENVKKLEKDLKRTSADFDKAKSQATAFQQTNENYQKLVGLHATEKEDLELDLVRLRQEVNNKKEAVAILNQSLEKERSENEEKISQRNRRADLLQQVVSQTKVENGTLKSGLEEAQAQHERLKKEYEEMRSANLKLRLLKAKPESEAFAKEGQERELLASMKRKRQDMEEEMEDIKVKRRALEENAKEDDSSNSHHAIIVENLSRQLKARNEQFYDKCGEFEEYKENSIAAARKIIEQAKKNFEADREVEREDLRLQVRSAQKEKEMYKEGMFRADMDALEGKLREHKEVLEALEQMPAKYRRKTVKKLLRRHEGEYMEEVMKEEMAKEETAKKNDDKILEAANVEAKVIPVSFKSSFKLPSLPAGILIQKPAPAPSFKKPSPASQPKEKITGPPVCPDTPRPNKISSVAPRSVQDKENDLPSTQTPFKSPASGNQGETAVLPDTTRPTSNQTSSSGKASDGGDEVLFVGQMGSEGRAQEKVPIEMKHWFWFL